MRRLVSGILGLFLLFALLFAQKVNVPLANGAPSIHQGNLILTGNNVTVIEGRFDINGSIIVRENATLILQNAIVNFTQTKSYEHNMTFENPANGNPRLECNNSTIASTSYYYFIVRLRQNSTATLSNSIDTRYLQLLDSASATVTNSSINEVTVANNAVASILNSTIEHTLSASSSVNVTVINSAINKVYINSAYSNCSLVNITPGFFSFWDFQLNCSLVRAYETNALNVSLVNTTVDDWQFLLQNSNATITDSTFGTLQTMLARIWMTNTTVASNAPYLSTVYVSWYLDVHVVDSIGQNVPSANVTAAYPNSTVAQQKLADEDGWARLTLMEKMMNDTGDYPIGNYTAKAEYQTYSDSIPVNMTGNQEVTLQLQLVIPEFPLTLILPLFMIATLAGILFHKRKHLTTQK